MKKIIRFLLLISPIIYSIIVLNKDLYFYLIAGIFFLIVSIRFTVKYNDKVKIWIQIGITYIFLDLTFHKIDFIQFIKNFQYIKIEFLIPVFIVIYLSLFLRAYKWKYLISHIKKLSTKNLFKATLLGFMGNAIFPARIGEVIRAVMISRYEKISKISALSSIILERIFDGLIVGGMFVYILLFNPIQNNTLNRTGIIISAIYVFAIIFMFLIYFKYDFIANYFNNHFEFIGKNMKKKIIHFFYSFYNGLHVFKNGKYLSFFILYTILVWIINIGEAYFFLKSMNIINVFLKHSMYSPLFFSVIFTFIMTVGVAIPSGPGSAGPLQASILFAFILVMPNLMKLPIKYNYIASFSMYVWIIQVSAVILGGTVVIIKDGLSFKNIRKLQEI